MYSFHVIRTQFFLQFCQGLAFVLKYSLFLIKRNNVIPCSNIIYVRKSVYIFYTVIFFYVKYVCTILCWPISIKINPNKL